MSDVPENLKFIAIALLNAGGEADLSRIYEEAAKVLPTWPAFYKNEEAFRGTIRSTLEAYCPQSEKYSPEREALFEKISRGRYRVVYPQDREAGKKRGRIL